MSAETLYSAINLGVLPAWALLLIAPRATITRRLAHSFIYPIVYGFIYLAFLVAGVFFGQAADGAGMADLAGVLALFSHPNGVLTGWTHYLVFDLFVGAWISRDALARGIPYWRIAPALIFTLMFGPVGLLIYVIIRTISGKSGLTLDEQSRLAAREP